MDIPVNLQIKNIRHSSREMVRELGLLSNHVHFHLSPTVIHSLIEIELHGAINQMELVTILNLDKSSISRIIKKLAQLKLVTMKTHTDDQRYKRIMLTTEGKKLLAKIHQLADYKVHSALDLLSTEERNQVEFGLLHYAKALRRSRVQSNFVIRAIQKSDNLEIMMIIKKVLKEYGGDRPGFAFVDPELDDMHQAYSKNKWAYFIIEHKHDSKVIGGAGLGPLVGGDKSICELKKMYILPEYRGTGLGASLFQKLLIKVKEFGYQQVYLETSKHMERANHLYKSFGFKQLDKPMGNTGHFGCDAWYLKNI